MYRATVILLALIAVAAIPAMAQPVIAAKSGMVTGVWGEVMLDGQPQNDQIVAEFPYMKENGTLSTGRGRAEVAMNPGIMVRIGENTTLRLITNRLIDTRVELVKGSAIVQYPEVLKDNNFTLVLKDAVVLFPKAGDYRFDTDPLRVKVFTGQALVEVNGQKVEVGGGKLLDLTGGTASVAKFDKEQTDALERWSAGRAELQAMANLSAAKQVLDEARRLGTSCFGSTFSPAGYVSANPCQGTWRYNPWFGLVTYIPIMRHCDFWGNCYYGPREAAQIYYPPPPRETGGGMGMGPGYSVPSPTSSGSSGTMAVSSGAVSAPSAGSGSSAGAAAASSSVGRSTGGGGSRGQ